MNEFQNIREKVSSMNVLIVDDESAIREQAILFMEKFCKNVDSAVDGEDALNKICKNNNYDIVLTDIRMPKMTGLELTDKINNMNKKLFIGVMSGSYALYNKISSRYDIFLEKPININNMKVMLEKVIAVKGL